MCFWNFHISVVWVYRRTLSGGGIPAAEYAEVVTEAVYLPPDPQDPDEYTATTIKRAQSPSQRHRDYIPEAYADARDRTQMWYDRMMACCCCETPVDLETGTIHRVCWKKRGRDETECSAAPPPYNYRTVDGDPFRAPPPRPPPPPEPPPPTLPLQHHWVNAIFF